MNPQAVLENLDRALARQPRRLLGQWPTPLVPMNEIGGAWVKREDLASTVYGGNKVRKLEFLLADPACERAEVIISIGAVGSHHLEALSIYKKPEQELIGVLMPQPMTPKVWATLGVLLKNGVTLVGAKTELGLAAEALKQQALQTLKGRRPYLILPGGSMPLGCLGWVRAGVEVAVQCEEQGLGQVVAHVTPAGSLGTAVGLRVGLALAGCKTRVVTVQVAPGGYTNQNMVNMLTTGLLGRLSGLGVARPNLDTVPLELVKGYLGPGYGHLTPQAEAALNRAPELLGLGLEPTYAAKTFACFLDRFGQGLPGGQSAIFYQTFNQTPQPGLGEDETRERLKHNPAVAAALAMTG